MNSRTHACLSVTGEAAAALMVCWTLHHYTPVPGSAVHLEVLLREPLVHDGRPALGIRLAPPGNHLHVIKYLTYKKIKLNLLNLKTNQY